MAFKQQGGGGLKDRVVASAMRKLVDTVPPEDRTDDPVAVTLRYLSSVDPDEWEFVRSAFDHTTGTSRDNRDFQDILYYLTSADDPQDQMIELLLRADAGDFRATRYPGRALSIKFQLQLGRMARAHEGADLNPKNFQSIVGKIVRAKTTKIAIFHGGPGYGVK